MRTPVRPIALAALSGAVLALSAAAGSGAAPADDRLRRFADCAEFLDHVQRHALPQVDWWTPWVYGPWPTPGPPVPVPLPPQPPPPPAAPPPPPAPPVGGNPPVSNPPASGTGDDTSRTNVQEAGVDEPDLVKADGARLFAIGQGRLHSIALRPPRRLLDRVGLPRGLEHDLFLHGDRALVISREGGHEADGRQSRVENTETVMTEIDVGNPASLRVLRTLTVEGTYRDARLVGGTARIVFSSIAPDRLPIVAPAAPGPDARAAAIARNREAVRAAGAATWLPSLVLRDLRTKKSIRSLVQCRDVWRPPDFSGFGLTSVLTIDLDRGLRTVDVDGVMADGSVVYASTKGLYVASRALDLRATLSVPAPSPPPPVSFAPPQSPRPIGGTALHKFDSSAPNRTEYAASGRLDGVILNEWSLSEHEGFLRVATTEGADFDEGSESAVTVLKERAGRLVRVGRVDGLGKGERIFGVRFLGEVGYVVTFRETDPLYTVDLSSPIRPRVLGNLKIPGYSAYLHPVGEDLLLGIGQETELGGQRGTLVSLFDVADLKRPVRLERRFFPSAFTEAEEDHHAFLYWAPTRLAVLPLDAPQEFVGAVGLRVGRSTGLDVVGRISHQPGGKTQRYALSDSEPIRRTVVSGDALLTVSRLGIKVSDSRTLASRGWVAFP